MAKHAGKERTVMTGRCAVQWLRELDPRIGPPFELWTLLPMVLAATVARSVANRAHSMLDGTRFRATQRQAYGICVSDPAAFRRIVRGF
jgi:predicted trehalose synthase